MKKLDFRRWFLLLCTGLFSVLTFAGCTDDKEQDYLYSIGINSTSIPASGPEPECWNR